MTEQGYPGQQVPTLVTGPSDEQVALRHKRSSARWKLDAAHLSHSGSRPISAVRLSPDDLIEAFNDVFDLLDRGARQTPRPMTVLDRALVEDTWLTTSAEQQPARSEERRVGKGVGTGERGS